MENGFKNFSLCNPIISNYNIESKQANQDLQTLNCDR